MVTNAMLTGRMGRIPILPVTVPITMIKGATHQCYGDGDGVVQCKQTFKTSLSHYFINRKHPK